MKLDTTDLRILAELQADGSLSNVELSRRVHLSPSPCLARVKALETEGVIARYVALANAAALGLGLNVFISNAERSAVLLKAAGIERIALVTHGWHMVRAAKTFERAGLQVLPAPMGFKVGQARKLYRVLPRASALADSSLALHEWLGILAQHGSLDR